MLPRPTRCSLAYQYVISNPEVLNPTPSMMIAAWHGMVASKGMLPSQLLPINTDLNDIEPWTHYFGCAFFAATHVPCSTDETWVSRFTDTFTGLNPSPSTSLRLPRARHRKGLPLWTQGHRHRRRPGVQGRCYYTPSSLNPTRTVLSFEEVEPCRPFHLCLSTPLMRTKAGSDPPQVVASYGDFIRSVLYGAAFKLYLIILLLIMLTGAAWLPACAPWPRPTT